MMRTLPASWTHSAHSPMRYYCFYAKALLQLSADCQRFGLVSSTKLTRHATGQEEIAAAAANCSTQDTNKVEATSSR